MTAGFFSPMPPARTGVADYSAALAAALRAHGEVRINTAGDVQLYHLGNNPLHAAIYERALAEPGVIVLHDAVLHHFLLGHLGEERYVEEFVYNYGAWNVDLARRLWANRGASASTGAYFDYAMLRRAAERARAIVVHNPAAARIVAAHAPTARIVEIPHLWISGPEPAAAQVERARASLGIARPHTLFGVFGHLRESKRIRTVVDCFEHLRAAGEPVALVVAGECVSEQFARTLEVRLRGTGVHRIGYLSEQDFWLWAHAVDACINLRHPAAGETSGIAIRLMGIAKPVLVTAGEETARFPESAVLRIDSGLAESDMLSAYMLWVTRLREHARAAGACAARHIAQHHAPARVAAAYWKLLAECRA